MLNNNNYICAIDVGSSKIAAALARIEKGKVSDIFLETENTRAIKDGSVVDSLELVACVGRILKHLRNKSGVRIKTVLVNICGQDIILKHSRALIPLAQRGNKVVTISDLEKAAHQARILGSSLDEEIIHEIPFSYSIDTKSNITNPLGLYSHRLEVDLYLICAKNSALQNLSRIINQAGFDLKDVFLSGIATSYVVFPEHPQKGMNILCDIGSDITEMLFFENGYLKDIRILRHGGVGLTLALARELNLGFELAEDVKRLYASAGDYDQIPEEKEILVKKDNLYRPIKQKLAAKVITEKTKEIAAAIHEALEKTVSLSEIESFQVSGRTVLAEGFLELLESSLGIPVRLARLNHPQMMPFTQKNQDLSGHKYLSYLTALGMIVCALGGEMQPRPLAPGQVIHNPLLRLVNRAKEVYQEYF